MAIKPTFPHAAVLGLVLTKPPGRGGLGAQVGAAGSLDLPTGAGGGERGLLPDAALAVLGQVIANGSF